MCVCVYALVYVDVVCVRVVCLHVQDRVMASCSQILPHYGVNWLGTVITGLTGWVGGHGLNWLGTVIIGLSGWVQVGTVITGLTGWVQWSQG